MAPSLDELRQLQKLPIPGAVPVNMGGGMQPLPVPQMPAVVGAPPLPTPVSNSTNQLMHAQGELSRLQTTGAGVDQIKNPFLRGLAKVGTGIESALLPGFAQQTPGTELHHQMLMGQQQGQIDAAQKNLQSEAQTKLLDAQPELKQMGLENQMLKTQGTIQHQQDMNELGHDKLLGSMKEHGYAPDETDPTGHRLRPLRYEEMAPIQQMKYDVDMTQKAVNDAEAEYKKAQAANVPINIQLALGRLQVARQNAATAAQRIFSRPVQVIDPDNPDNTKYMRVGDAMATGAAGVGSASNQTRKALQKDFTSGGDAHTLNAINTARGHVVQLGAAADALKNGNIQLLNKIANQYGVATGQSAPVVFQAIKTALTGELGKAFSGTGATVSEQAEISKALNDAQSPEQLKAFANTNIHLMDTKKESLQRQYESGQSGKPNFGNDVGPKVGDIESGYRFKGGDPKDQKNWEKAN